MLSVQTQGNDDVRFKRTYAYTRELPRMHGNSVDSNAMVFNFLPKLFRPAKNRTRARNATNDFRNGTIEILTIDFTLVQLKSHTNVRCVQMHLLDPDYCRNIISKPMECRCNHRPHRNSSKSIDVEPHRVHQNVEFLNQDQEIV